MKILFFLNSHRFELLEIGKSTFHERLWYSTLTSPAHTRVTLQNIAGRARYCISPYDVHVAARRVPGYRDCVARHRPWMSFDISRHATCVIFAPSPGVDIGETTSRPFIPQWRLNTSERAAAFPRYCARGMPARNSRTWDEWGIASCRCCQCFPNWLSSRDSFLRPVCDRDMKH